MDNTYMILLLMDNTYMILLLMDSTYKLSNKSYKYAVYTIQCMCNIIQIIIIVE